MTAFKKYSYVTLRVLLCIFLGTMVFHGIQEIFGAWGVGEGSLLDGLVVLLSLYVMGATYNPKQVLNNIRESVDRFDSNNGLDNINKQ